MEISFARQVTCCQFSSFCWTPVYFLCYFLLCRNSVYFHCYSVLWKHMHIYLAWPTWLIVLIASREILCLEKLVKVLQLALSWATFYHWALARWGRLLYDISTEPFLSDFLKRFLKAVISMEIIPSKVRIKKQSYIFLGTHSKTRCDKIMRF